MTTPPPTAPPGKPRGRGTAPADGPPHDALYRKVSWRLLPFLMLCYIFNYIDRINVSVAALGFKQDLGFSDAVYGLGAGLFFVGFLLFELPSNLLLARDGARRTLLRIMLLWGLVSAGTMFVRTPAQFYAARLLLGAAEAGFFPGIILYLTYWYPARRRATITARFLLGLPIAGVIGGPLSGWIMERFAGIAGLAGWQWLFLLEGLPSAVLGVAAYWWLDDRPAGAAWLSSAEQSLLLEDLAEDERRKPAPAGHATLAALRDPRVYLAGSVSFTSYLMANTIAFWTPLVIRSAGVAGTFDVGALSAVPFLAGALSMTIVSRHSDRTLERRWHTSGGLATGALGLALLPLFTSDATMAVTLLALTAAGHYAALAVFWTIPSAYLGSAAAAGGIGVVSTIGALGGAVAPALLGWVKTETGSLERGLQMLAAMVAIGAVILLVAIPAHVLREGGGQRES